MHYIVFDAIVNEIDFLISFSENLLSLYRNATDFCVLVFLSYNFTEIVD